MVISPCAQSQCYICKGSAAGDMALPCSSTFMISTQQSYSTYSSSITASSSLGLTRISSVTSSTCGPCMVGFSFSHASADHQTSSPWPGPSAPQDPTPIGLGSPDTIRNKHETAPSESSISVTDNPCPRQGTTAAGSLLQITFFKMFANRTTYSGAQGVLAGFYLHFKELP